MTAALQTNCMQVAWLALEVKYLREPLEFYRERLGLKIQEETENEARLEAGDTTIVLRTPHSVPRGGLHTHYAFSTRDIDVWMERLADLDPETRSFGGSRSMYFYDPTGNCVEIGERGSSAEIDGIFEVVLEVEDLERAREFYARIAEPYGGDDSRRRVRLDAGEFDFELWEPHLGIMDGQGGVHVDIGVRVDDVEANVDGVRGMAASIEEARDGVRVRDPDGHYLTFV